VPLLDRIDLHIDVPALKEDELIGASIAENSKSIRARVEKAGDIQIQLQDKANFALGSLEVDGFCQPDEAGLTLLKITISRLNLSARAYQGILKIAHTIADLVGETAIKPVQIAEAVQYRREN